MAFFGDLSSKYKETLGDVFQNWRKISLTKKYFKKPLFISKNISFLFVFIGLKKVCHSLILTF